MPCPKDVFSLRLEEGYDASECVQRTAVGVDTCGLGGHPPCHGTLCRSGRSGSCAQDGVFARDLVAALEDFDRADRSGDHQLSVEELADYVQDRIQGQHPQLLGGYQDVPVVDRRTRK